MWVNEKPESTTQQQFVLSLIHDDPFSLASVLHVVLLSGIVRQNDRYFSAAMHAPNFRDTLAIPNSRNNMQSTPSDITEGTKGGSRRKNVELLEEYVARGMSV
jgi:hypothetical protein